MRRPRLTTKVRRGFTLWKQNRLVLQISPTTEANPPSLPPLPSNLRAAQRSDLESFYAFVRDQITFIEHTTPAPPPTATPLPESEDENEEPNDEGLDLEEDDDDFESDESDSDDEDE